MAGAAAASGSSPPPADDAPSAGTAAVDGGRPRSRMTARPPRRECHGRFSTAPPRPLRSERSERRFLSSVFGARRQGVSLLKARHGTAKSIDSADIHDQMQREAQRQQLFVCLPKAFVHLHFLRVSADGRNGQEEKRHGKPWIRKCVRSYAATDPVQTKLLLTTG